MRCNACNFDFGPLNSLPYGILVCSCGHESRIGGNGALGERHYYDELGYIGIRLVATCKVCNESFAYYYKGGPKRSLCPEHGGRDAGFIEYVGGQE
jgi:hypothetical protein